MRAFFGLDRGLVMQPRVSQTREIVIRLIYRQLFVFDNLNESTIISA